MFEIRDIILIILVIIVIYLLYKNINKEKFSTTPDNIKTEIINAVDTQYSADIDAMRNLAGIANDILKNNDTLKIPANNTNAINLSLTGNLNLPFATTFNYKNNDIRNYLIGAFLYKIENLVLNVGDNAANNIGDTLPILLTVGKNNLIIKSSSEDSVNAALTVKIVKIIINAGFRIKLWTGIFNNYRYNDSNLLPTNIPNSYYNGGYNGTTPAIIENRTNEPMTIIPPTNSLGDLMVFPIKSVEIEMI